MLLEKIMDQFKVINSIDLHEIELPFLQRVAKAWACSTSASNLAYRVLFLDIFHRYLIKYVQPEPEVPGIVRPPIRCLLTSTCTTCKTINTFLQHPKSIKSPEIQVPVADYKHVKSPT
jgi:hypothetical protein